MMRDSSATKKTRLLNPWSLVVVALVIGTVLWLSFQKEDVFRPNGDADEVSANYAELLLSSHPKNAVLRVQLIELLIKLGDYARARQHVQQWPEPDLALQAYYQLEVDGAAQAGRTDAVALQALSARLHAVDYKNLSLAQMQRLAPLALSLQEPALAAEIFDTLAKRDTPNSTQWLKSAAQWHLASGNPARAADIYLQFLRTEQNSPDHRFYQQQALQALLGAGRGEQALTLLTEQLEATQDPLTLDQLELGVNLAVGQKRFDLAERFFSQWRQQQPDDPQVLYKEFKLRLAFGDLAGAWPVGQSLSKLHPQDAELMEQMAHLAEWRGDAQAALGYWIEFLNSREDSVVRERSWRLALQLFDFDHAVVLLADIMKQRVLSEDELDSLIYAHETRGTPEQAETWLRSYVRKYPRQREAWVHLLQNLENTEQYQAKVVAWKNMSAQFPLTLVERQDWATTYLKLFDSRSAWKVLDIDTRKIKSEDYWQMRASLAWDLELDDQMRLALEQLRSIKGSLDHGNESLLISLYRDEDPRKALQLTVDIWQRDRDPQRLVAALQLAQQLQDWEQVASLLKGVETDPAGDRPQVFAARGALAMQQGKPDQALEIYQQGLKRFPQENLFRERTLWVYVDAGNVKALKPLLIQWRSLARKDRLLWLPFASASQLTGRTSEALAWYRLYLAGNDSDWLIQAAYADALQAAGYLESAQRLRLQLTRTVEPNSLKDTPQRYAMWLRLMASSYSPAAAQKQIRQSQDGSPAMLQLWFERLLARLDATNQQMQKDAWLAWARSNGLRIERYEQIQEALRNRNRPELERMLANVDMDPAQRVEVLNRLGRSGEALSEGLSALGDEQPEVVRQQLLRQTVEMHERTPQGAQLSWNRQDFGGLEFNAVRLTAARNLGDNWYASAVLEQGRYQGDLLNAGLLGNERNLILSLQRQLAEGSYKLILDSSLRDDNDRNGLGLSRTWLLDSRNELSAGLDWHRKSEESGLMRALGQQDSLWFNGRHRFSARDQLSWTVAQRAFSLRDGDSLGNGQALKMEYNHTLEFEGPNWVLRGGLDYQHNSLSSRSLESLSSNSGGPIIRPQVVNEPVILDPEEVGEQITQATNTDTPLTARDLLQQRYGQLYVGSSWRRGFPGALNRSRPQYTWLLDTTAGWQWMSKTFNYGVSTGVGIELLGDDELAVTVGYQSAPLSGNGQAGGTLGVSYGVRLGR